MRHAELGITLIEACIVIAVCAIIAATAVPSMRDLMDRQSLRGSADELRSDLQYLRSASVSRNQHLWIAILSAASGSCYVMHSGNAGDCRCDGTSAPVCNNGAQVLKSVGFASNGAVQLRSNVNEPGFEPTRGAVTPGGTLTLSVARSGDSVSEVVSGLGRIRSCSPNVSGYKPC